MCFVFCWFRHCLPQWNAQWGGLSWTDGHFFELICPWFFLYRESDMETLAKKWTLDSLEVDVLIQDANLLGSSLGLWLFLNSAVVCRFPSGGFTMGRAKSLSWYVVFLPDDDCMLLCYPSDRWRYVHQHFLHSRMMVNTAFIWDAQYFGNYPLVMTNIAMI